MRNKVLLDSDTISYYFKGNEKVLFNLTEYLNFQDSINISIISYYEIISGLLFRDSNKRIGQFKDFVRDSCIILPLTKESVSISGQLYALLRKKGTPVDDIDLLIAGIAIENGLSIVTNNVKHFGKISQIEIENWCV